MFYVYIPKWRVSKLSRTLIPCARAAIARQARADRKHYKREAIMRYTRHQTQLALTQFLYAGDDE